MRQERQVEKGKLSGVYNVPSLSVELSFVKIDLIDTLKFIDWVHFRTPFSLSK